MSKRKPPSPLLIDILCPPPDPSDFGALLSAAVAAHCARTGATKAAVARLAGIARGNFTTALRNPDARPATVRAVCRALGLKVALVPSEEPLELCRTCGVPSRLTRFGYCEDCDTNGSETA